MSTDEDQWSDAARDRYLRSVEALIEELRRHARLVGGLERERFQHDPDTHRMYVTSEDLLHRSIAAVTDAELDWSGSSSMPYVEADEEEDLEELDDLLGQIDEEEREAGEIISLVGRWDIEVVDREAFVAAGRAAYAEFYELVDPSLAELSVSDSLQSAGALVQLPQFPELEVDGATVPLGAFWTFVQHTEPLTPSTDLDSSDPFDIARTEGD
ncbi:MAG: hypothetical protein Q4G40_08625 [Brachybacterium sp.]|nr:hypothetical protein [Brachybacterium sp.]